MINSTQRWLGLVAVLVTITHAGVRAQNTTQLPRNREANSDREPAVVTASIPSSSSALREAFASEAARQVRATLQTAPQKAVEKPMTRGRKAAFGAAIVGGIGALIGYSMESRLDTPEGTGALLFGGIGAGLGALIGWNYK